MIVCEDCKKHVCENCHRRLPVDYDELVYRPRHEGPGQKIAVCNNRCAASFLDSRGPYLDTLQPTAEAS